MYNYLIKVCLILATTDLTFKILLRSTLIRNALVLMNQDHYKISSVKEASASF